MTRTATLADLEARRADVARRADDLQAQLERYPHKELRTEFDRLCRLIDCYDATIATLTKPRGQRR
jgi:hypothetical protein